MTIGSKIGNKKWTVFAWPHHLVGHAAKLCGWANVDRLEPHVFIMQASREFCQPGGQVTLTEPVTKFRTTTSSVKVKAKNIYLGLMHDKRHGICGFYGAGRLRQKSATEDTSPHMA